MCHGRVIGVITSERRALLLQQQLGHVLSEKVRGSTVAEALSQSCWVTGWTEIHWRRNVSPWGG